MEAYTKEKEVVEKVLEVLDRNNVYKVTCGAESHIFYGRTHGVLTYASLYVDRVICFAPFDIFGYKGMKYAVSKAEIDGDVIKLYSDYFDTIIIVCSFNPNRKDNTVGIKEVKEADTFMIKSLIDDNQPTVVNGIEYYIIDLFRINWQDMYKIPALIHSFDNGIENKIPLDEAYTAKTIAYYKDDTNSWKMVVWNLENNDVM